MGGEAQGPWEAKRTAHGRRTAGPIGGRSAGPMGGETGPTTASASVIRYHHHGRFDF